MDRTCKHTFRPGCEGLEGRQLLTTNSILHAASQSTADVALFRPLQVQSYPLTIRGGGTLTIACDGSNGVLIHFQPAPGPVYMGLAPGQGSWSDRALSSGEPTTIYDSAADAAQYVDRLLLSDQYVILQVYNDGQGHMRVTGVGP